MALPLQSLSQESAWDILMHQEDRKSTSGYLFQMAGGPVSWKSRKQDSVALSTAEAEYIALSSAAQCGLEGSLLNLE